ncbi:hypothetical protein AQUCO_00500463v1 [Aquilegia coerulea]|uniref:Uncharacterized protein n=1 Tax=Aquilegia coerulea TaxID=218851 RepID=A0A2G5ES29_AQUCA|nr:hypothetical protein AQUCO_00500463v1 [Aquilegia coerulea]
MFPVLSIAEYATRLLSFINCLIFPNLCSITCIKRKNTARCQLDFCSSLNWFAVVCSPYNGFDFRQVF